MSLNIDIEKTYIKEEFFKKISHTIIEIANQCIDDTGKFTIALSGGRTPKYVYKHLIDNHSNSVDWTKVHFFWVDERCVEPTNNDSNYYLAYENLISKLATVGSVNRIKGELDPNLAANSYEQDLIKFFQNKLISLDLILLGMGEDGHVASLFPNTKELYESKKTVLSTNKEHNGFYRVTLSKTAINNSKFNLLILNGKMKYEIFKTHNLPKDLIKIDSVIVYCD